MKKTMVILILFMSLLACFTSMAEEQLPSEEPKSSAQEKEKAPLEITKDILFFTEPYTHLEPPEKNLIAMCLGLDYSSIKYPLGLVNTLDITEPLIEFKKRIVIQDPEQLDRLMKKSLVRVGDSVTVVSAEGIFHKAKVKSFSYVGNSPSTIIVAADLEPEPGNHDPSLFNSHGIAIRGGLKLQAGGAIRAEKPLKNEHPMVGRLKDLCASDLLPGHIIQDVKVMPAVLEPGAEPCYFVSFWKRPSEEFEIEDIELDSCMFSHSGDSWTRSRMPLPLRLIQVYDLDQDNKAEIFAMTGNGMEVCYVYLVPKGDGKYTMVRKGLCAGY